MQKLKILFEKAEIEYFKFENRSNPVKSLDNLNQIKILELNFL